jgi:hypothetical protein
MSSTHSDPEKLGQGTTTSDSDSDVVYTTEKDAELEKRVWYKMDWWLLPIVALFYLLSFLVCSCLGVWLARNSIEFARIERIWGMLE